MEAITDRGGNQANTATKTEAMLMCKSSPLNDNYQYYKLFPPLQSHTQGNPSKRSNEAYTPNQSKTPLAETRRCMAPNGNSGTEIKREWLG